MYRSNENESVFTWAAPPLKFGIGALDEVGAELSALGSESCLVITDRASKHRDPRPHPRSADRRRNQVGRIRRRRSGTHRSEHRGGRLFRP